MTNPTIAEIAGKLTAAQKRVLLGTLGKPMKRAAYARVRVNLMRKGLWANDGFTELGLSVRTYLQEQER